MRFEHERARFQDRVLIISRLEYHIMHVFFLLSSILIGFIGLVERASEKDGDEAGRRTSRLHIIKV
jgi:hypothetical protein